MFSYEIESLDCMRSGMWFFSSLKLKLVQTDGIINLRCRLLSRWCFFTCVFSWCFWFLSFDQMADVIGSWLFRLLATTGTFACLGRFHIFSQQCPVSTFCYQIASQLNFDKEKRNEREKITISVNSRFVLIDKTKQMPFTSCFVSWTSAILTMMSSRVFVKSSISCSTAGVCSSFFCASIDCCM